MIDLKLTKKRLSMHWHYYRIKYVLFVVAALVAANLLLTGTTPKTPADRKVDVILLSGAYGSDDVQALQQELLVALPPDQMEVNLLATPLVEGQDIQTILAARMAAHEGDIWILPSDYYRAFAQDGAFIPLEDMLAELNLPEGFDPSAARVIVQEEEGTPGQQHTCGIPLDSFKGLIPYFIPEGMVLAFPAFTKVNFGNARLVADRLFAMTDLNIEFLEDGQGNFSLYIATQYIDFKGAAAWTKAISQQAGSVEMAGVFSIPYQLGRESQVAGLLQSRVPNDVAGILMVRREVFTILARQGKLMPLEDAASKFKLPEGFDDTAGRASAVDKKGVAGEEKLYGIPLDSFTGLSAVFNPQGMVLAFPVMGSELLATSISAANTLLGQGN